MTAPADRIVAVSAGLLERLDIVISREWGEDCELAEYVRTVASALRERAKRGPVAWDCELCHWYVSVGGCGDPDRKHAQKMHGRETILPCRGIVRPLFLHGGGNRRNQ